MKIVLDILAWIGMIAVLIGGLYGFGMFCDTMVWKILEFIDARKLRRKDRQ